MDLLLLLHGNCTHQKIIRYLYGTSISDVYTGRLYLHKNVFLKTIFFFGGGKRKKGGRGQIEELAPGIHPSQGVGPGICTHCCTPMHETFTTRPNILFPGTCVYYTLFYIYFDTAHKTGWNYTCVCCFMYTCLLLSHNSLLPLLNESCKQNTKQD